ncbi:RNA polymerase II transcription factor B subunit 1 [Spathaspora sp. JA1]|nr:RNA polymerase II transcription factor B subunit 1 [Spathaspora sp. JA1]
MDIVRGACSVDKVGGMIYIREDLAPSILEWKAIETDKSLSIPLNSLTNLQSTKESSPKMILKIVYKENNEEISAKFTFSNRPTMNNIKDSLQAIVARTRTRVEATPVSATSTPPPSSGNTTTSSNGAPTSVTASGATAAAATSTPTTATVTDLSDAALLKNLALQQKLLYEDRTLRDTFTKTVMSLSLSPTIFWSSRIPQLRTFALTISQHKGPYNVLSTIKPVATSDNQVNVNVTREMINEIFEIYPVIKLAFDDLVPHKFNEGEFWSRFFNSKLFRRLRGDKINLGNLRGDVVLDKYLYVDENTKKRKGSIMEIDKDEQEQGEEAARKRQDVTIHKFLDLLGNQEDNSQKLGNKPDFTMRYEDNGSTTTTTGENEMIVLMKNMNKLSSKMMSTTTATTTTEPEKEDPKKDMGLSISESNEFNEELNLHDLNDVTSQQYIKLNIDPNLTTNSSHKTFEEDITPDQLSNYISQQFTTPRVDLTDTFIGKSQDIDRASTEITTLVKHNFRNHRSDNRGGTTTTTNIVPNDIFQEIISYNVTTTEFLSHFWSLFLRGNNPGQLRKLFTSLKNSKTGINELKARAMTKLEQLEVVKSSEKVKDRVIKELNVCLEVLEVAIDKACNEYVAAVKQSTGANTGTPVIGTPVPEGATETVT